MDNAGDFVLDLINAEGNPAGEPDCRVEFIRLDGVSFTPSNHLEFPPQHRFTLPAFPQGRNLHCAITPSRYRALQSEFFTLEADGEITQNVTVMRDPSAWQPNFKGWNALSGHFDPLKKTLDNNLVKLKHGPDVGQMTPALYDGMSTQPQLLAKMAMLNLFAVLVAETDPVSTQPWFNFVNQIIVIDQERFVARVSSDLFESVDHIAKNISSFHKQGFFPGDTSLHTDNIPSDYQMTAKMISVKCAYEQGNLQLTVVPVTKDGNKFHLVDADMDENSNLFLHLADLFKHAFTGGTHPVDIHEYIVQKQQGVDLGYGLQPPA